MTLSRQAIIARCINAIIPGGGLIFLGDCLSGTLLAMLFGLGANAAVASFLLFPDDVPPLVAFASVVEALAAYVMAQWLLVARIRGREIVANQARRAEILRIVIECIRERDVATGLRHFAELGDAHEHDLLVAYRRAQLLSLSDDVLAARSAWQKVRVLDRHGLYREECTAVLRASLEPQTGSDPGQSVSKDA